LTKAQIQLQVSRRLRGEGHPGHNQMTNPLDETIEWTTSFEMKST
jgi:hypothetical protein